jgi:hypothetical protein
MSEPKVEQSFVQVFYIYRDEWDDEAMAELRFYEGDSKAVVYVDNKYAGEYRPPNPFEIDPAHFISEFDRVPQ